MICYDESAPWSASDYRKYAEYVKLRKERDEFLKSLREQYYSDWLIDKKLIDAGGIGKTIYILPARGGGSNLSRETLKRYLEEGRNVKVATLKKYEPPKLSSKDIETIRESIRQFELYSELINPWKEPWYQEMFKDFYPVERERKGIRFKSTLGDYICSYDEMLKRQYFGVLEDKLKGENNG